MVRLIYRRYRCLKEHGWWYTWHKILYKVFGAPDPETDPVLLAKMQRRNQGLSVCSVGTLETGNRFSRLAHDICFVSGVSEQNAPQCLRYRVHHQIEQLTAMGYAAVWIPYELCTRYTPMDCRAIVFYRCPFTEGIGEAIQAAKTMNIRVYYDIGDLVFDTDYTNLIPAISKMNRADKSLYDNGVVRMGATMSLCEYGITTTKRLQNEMQKVLPNVFINRNCSSEERLQ